MSIVEVMTIGVASLLVAYTLHRLHVSFNRWMVDAVKDGIREVRKEDKDQENLKDEQISRFTNTDKGE